MVWDGIVRRIVAEIKLFISIFKIIYKHHKSYHAPVQLLYRVCFRRQQNHVRQIFKVFLQRLNNHDEVPVQNHAPILDYDGCRHKIKEFKPIGVSK